MTEHERRSLVRYIFGSYEPYREMSARLPTDGADHDRSYAAVDHLDDLYNLYDEDDDLYDDFYGSLPVEGVAGRGRLRGEAGRVYEDDIAAYHDGYDDGDGYDEFGPDDVDDDGMVEVAVASTPMAPRVRADVPAHHLEMDRSRRRSAPGHVRRFPRPVSRAGVPSPGAVAHRAAGSRAALHRRRRVFVALSAILLVTLVGVGVLRTPAAWIAHGMAVMLLAGYIVLLVMHHQRIEEQARKVRDLEADRRRGLHVAGDVGDAEVAR